MHTAPLPPARSKVHPVIVVPGITATGLTDWYPASPAEVWSPTRLALGDYEAMMLHPIPPAAARARGHGPAWRFEASQPALVLPSRPFGIIYDDLVAELRHDLACDDVPVQPVYVFAYDWRQDNFITIRRLAEFVDEVIERTRLLPHEAAYVSGESCDAVDLVGHSMGGTLIAACIASGLVGMEASCKVRRVVTLGTPFRGAPAAIAKLATGLGSLTGRAAKERERAAARVTPSVYQLLPTYPGGIVRLRTGVAAGACDAASGPSDASWSAGSGVLACEDTPADCCCQPAPTVWEDATIDEALLSQPSIAESLASFLRTRAVRVGTHDDAGTAARAAEAVLRDFLRSAERFASLVWAMHPGMLRQDPQAAGADVCPALSGGGWLALAGAGERTHVRCEIVGGQPDGAVQLDFGRGFCEDHWDGVSWDTGDDTVPMRSAAPPWPDGWRDTVVVRRDDFDWLGELGDRVLRDHLGLHATLPRLNLAQRWVVNFLKPEWAGGATPGYRQHGKVWGRPAPGFWGTDGGEWTLKQIRDAPGRRDEIVQSAMQQVWSARLPGIRLSPARMG